MSHFFISFKFEHVILEYIGFKGGLAMKKLCKFKDKNFSENKAFILLHTKAPKFICRKCLRVSNTKKLLCKGEDI